MPDRSPIVLVLPLLAALPLLPACGRSVAADRLAFGRGDASSLRSYAEPPIDAPTPPGTPSLVVPPDRVLFDLAVDVNAEGFARATARVRDTVEALVAEVEGADGCEARLADQTPPTATDDPDEFRGHAQLRIDVAMTDLEATEARAARVDACLGHLLAFTPPEGVQLRLSPPLVTLDDPAAHLPALLRARVAPLRALSEAAEIAPQLDRAGVRCRSSGVVSIVGRQLSGVTVAVDFACADT